MLMQMRAAFYLQCVMGTHQQLCCGSEHHQATLPAHSLLKAATVDGATFAGLQDKIGSLTPDKQADLILTNAHDINLYPSNNTFGTVVNAAESNNIDTLMIAGQISLANKHAPEAKGTGEKEHVEICMVGAALLVRPEIKSIGSQACICWISP